MNIYRAIDQQIAESVLATSAAEAQGYVCGLLCAFGPQQVKLPENDPVLAKLLQQSQQQLAGDLDDSFQFRLLLPDDEQALEERVIALGEWCQGFLAGLGEGGLTENNAKSIETAEILHDLSQIAQIHNYEYSDESENDYVELEEYVRMVLLMLYTKPFLKSSAANGSEC